MWGFLTALNDTLIPHLKQIFDLNYTKSQLINLAFFGSYFIFAQPAAKLIEAIGYKRTMIVGLAVMAFGVFLFCPLPACLRTLSFSQRRSSLLQASQRCR